MKLVCISDTHTYHDQIVMPPGDVLIHAGDYSFMGRAHERQSFLKWLKAQPYKHKLITPGNHDWDAYRTPDLIKQEFQDVGAQLLIDECIHIDKQCFYFSPYTPEFFDWAFMYPRMDGKQVWDKIPPDVNVLVTHGPPQGILDYCGENVGCKFLRDEVLKIKPKYHIFGHIHEGYGSIKGDITTFVNASICTRNYKATNKPIVLEI
jgi:Icc-related predicted phosphoesterase